MGKPPRLSEFSPEQLRARAEEFRRMADTARAVGSRDALLQLAEHFESIAREREAEAAHASDAAADPDPTARAIARSQVKREQAGHWAEQRGGSGSGMTSEVATCHPWAADAT